MSYTLGEAAKATGKSKMTLQRAIKSGKLSARRREDGTYAIDPAELHRVFEPVSACDDQEGNMLQLDTPTGSPLLQLKITTLVEKIATLERERERERRDAQATLDDLRRRLDQEAEERRRLTLLLTDQRPQVVRKPWRGRFIWVGWMLASVLGVLLLALVFRELVGLVIPG